MFVTITAGNQPCVFMTFRPDQEDDTPLEPAKALQALLAIVFAHAFHRDHRGIEDAIQLGQIDTVRF